MAVVTAEISSLFWLRNTGRASTYASLSFDPSMRVDDPTLSIVAIRLSVVSFSGASVSMTVQRPLNSSISAMSFRISGVIVMLVMRCMADIHFHPFIAVSHPMTGKYPFLPIYSHSAEGAKVRSVYPIKATSRNIAEIAFILLPTFVPSVIG